MNTHFYHKGNTMKTLASKLCLSHLLLVVCIVGMGCHQLAADAESESTARAKAFAADSARPIRALYLTDYAAPWHNYQKQQ